MDKWGWNLLITYLTTTGTFFLLCVGGVVVGGLGDEEELSSELGRSNDESLSINFLTFDGRTNTPWFGLHLKYSTPPLLPSLLPRGRSSSTPNQNLQRKYID